MATATETTIDIKDIGPIARLSLPIPEGGGAVIIRGAQGSGKSTAIRAVDALLTGEGKLPVRDKQKFGTVTGAGVTLRVGRSTTRGGELEVQAIDSYEPIADLVDPGIDNLDAADNRRIKALIQLTGKTPDPAVFYELLGSQEEFEAVCTDTDTDDLVALAGKIKRQCEAAARKAEQAADQAEGHAKANREAAGAVDAEGESDAAKLQAALEAAVRAETEIRAADRNALKVLADATAAKDALEDAEAEYEGPNPTTAQTQLDMCKDAVAKADARVEDLKAQLDDAQVELRDAKKAVDRANEVLGTAKSHELCISRMRESIEAAANVERPPAAELTKAAEAVTAARQAVERGALIRDAKQKAAEADKWTKKVIEHRKQAIKLREAAKGTDNALSSVIEANGKLRVEAGRLITDTRRGPTFFAELSHGERCKIAADLALDAVGNGGHLPLSQEFWASLQPANKKLLVESARERGVLIIAPEVDDGELRAEVYAGR